MSVRSALLSFFALLMRILPQTTPTIGDSNCLMASFVTERHVGLRYTPTNLHSVHVLTRDARVTY